MATPIQIALSTGAAKFVFGGSGKVTSYSVYNPNTGAAYIQFFDTLLGPTVGGTTPKWSVAIPAATTTQLRTEDVYFRDGLWLAATTAATTGATATGVDVSLGIT